MLGSCKYCNGVDTEAREALNNKADLVDGVIPSSQLPSYVDDVLEYTSMSEFPETGESGKIYVDTSTNEDYRWSGTTYVITGSQLTIGETSDTAFAGNRGKALETKIATLNSTLQNQQNDIAEIISTIPKKVTVLQDDVDVTGTVNFNIVNIDGAIKKDVTLPYNFISGNAVTYGGEIHILGGSNSLTSHYKLSGSVWVSVSTLPYEFHQCSAVVYNNEIHILGGHRDGTNKTNHYKWNGTEWAVASTLPYEFYDGSAVVYNNELHILGGDVELSSTKNHYKWNGTEWAVASTLPYEFGRGSAVVLNNEIHIFGGYVTDVHTNHYKWSGTRWSKVSTLPDYGIACATVIVHNNVIHLLGDSTAGYRKNHYVYNDGTWNKLSDLLKEFYDGDAVIYNGDIHILGGEDMSAHYVIESNYKLEPVFL